MESYLWFLDRKESEIRMMNVQMKNVKMRNNYYLT